MVAPGRHRTLPPRNAESMRGTDRQCGMGHSQQGEPQLGEGVVDIADGGDAGDEQDAGRQGQVGRARKVRVG